MNNFSIPGNFELRWWKKHLWKITILVLTTSQDVPDKWSPKFIFKYYSAQSALKYFISLTIWALTLNQVLKFENSGKLLRQRVDNKFFGGDPWLVVVEHRSLLIHIGKHVANELGAYACQVVLIFSANIFSRQKVCPFWHHSRWNSRVFQFYQFPIF